MLSPKEIDKVLNKSTYVSPVDSNYLKKLEQQERKLLLQAQEKATAQEIIEEIEKQDFYEDEGNEYKDEGSIYLTKGRWQQIKEKYTGDSQ